MEMFFIKLPVVAKASIFLWLTLFNSCKKNHGTLSMN